MLRSDSVAAIAKALAKAQGEMKAAAKDHVNPAFKSKYADLASVWDVARSCLPKNDIAIFQNVTKLENGIGVETTLMHSSGEWIQSDPFFVPVARPDAHGTMSAVTYGKRGSLCAVCGIVADEPDDDGNAASGRTNTLVSASQAADLEALADEVGADKAAFLKYMRAESFAAIPAGKYADALAALQKKRAA